MRHKGPSFLKICKDEYDKLAVPDPKEPKSVMYGVVRQVIALSDRQKAEAYAAEINANSEKDAYYYVIERAV